MKRLRCLAVGFLLTSAISVPAVSAGESASTLSIIEHPGLAAIPAEELAGQSGRQGLDIVQTNNSEQLASLNENVLNNPGLTGYNSIDGGSIAGNVGFNTVIQNSGNQVVIQDSTLINIMFTK